MTDWPCRSFRLSFLLFALAMPNSHAVGQEIRVTPFYGWITGFNGQIGAFNTPPVHIDFTPIQVLENLDQIYDHLDSFYMGAIEVRGEKAGLLIDVFHVDLSANSSLPGPLFGDVSLSFRQSMITGMASYNLANTKDTQIDLLAGARYWNVGINFQVAPGLLPGLSARDSGAWIDPMVGVNAKHKVAENWSLSARGMLGTGSSNISWDAYAAMEYEWNNSVSLTAGFRAAGVDYQDNGFVYDVTMYGPVLGFSITF